MRSNAIKRSIFFSEILRSNLSKMGVEICSGNFGNSRQKEKPNLNKKIAKDIIDSSGLNFHSAIEFKEAADKVQEVL